MNPSSSTSPPNASREDLLQNAVLFLKDPKVQSSTFTSKVQFLESKGLTESEIQEALRRAAQQQPSLSVQDGGSGRYGMMDGYTSPAGYGMRMAVPPEPPRRDWRDMFIMAVISGGVIYGLATLARKYLMPHLQPPSSTSFQSTSAELTSQYDEAAKLLSELQTQTNALQANLDADRERYTATMDDVESAIEMVKDGEEKWREEMREIRGEVESIRELVPRLIEKHANSQTTSLNELQSELRSLKTLLQGRQAALSNSPSQVNGTNGSGNAGVSDTTKAANALLAPKGRGIPAWQLGDSSSRSGSPASSMMSKQASETGSGGSDGEHKVT